MARSLRLALAGTDDATRLTAEVEKRLRTIARSRGFIDWDKVRPLARELDALRETIAGPLAASSPRAAVMQMRLLLSLGAGVLERSDDGGGTLGEVFRQAGAALGRLWGQVEDRDPLALAGELLALLDADGYGVTDHLLVAARPRPRLRWPGRAASPAAGTARQATAAAGPGRPRRLARPLHAVHAPMRAGRPG